MPNYRRINSIIVSNRLSSTQKGAMLASLGANVYIHLSTKLKQPNTPLKILFNVALKFMCHIDWCGRCDMSCSTKCHVTPSLVVII